MADFVEEINLKLTGKVGDRVYWEKDGEKFSRAMFIPIQPGTPAQLARWNIFAAGVTAWHALTPAEMTAYNNRAKRYQFTGYNLFLREYLLSHP